MNNRVYLSPHSSVLHTYPMSTCMTSPSDLGKVTGVLF